MIHRQAYALSLVISLTLGHFAYGHSLRAKFSYTTLAPGGEYIFVMIAPKPVDQDGKDCGENQVQEIKRIRASYTVSGLYRNDGSRTPLWTLDWYAYEVYPASDGVHLVRRGLSRLWSAPRCDEYAVEFYARGQLLRSYKVRELVDLPRLLMNDSFVPSWRSDDAFEDATMRYSLHTVHGDRFIFDVRTGDILEGSRLAAWARSGTVAATFCALVVGVLVWRWWCRRRSIARPT